MKTIETKDGVRLHVQDWGEGEAVVLIHGWPLSLAMWKHQALALAEAGYRVIAYTRRGFGLSDQPWSGYDYDTMSDDLAAVLQGTKAKDVTLVGFSMGGGEVARYMGRHGGKGVVKAVLVSAVTPYMAKAQDNPDGVEHEVFEGIKKGLREDRPKFLAGFAKDFYGQGTDGGGVSDEWLDWSQSLALQASPKATLDCVDAFAYTDFRGDLSGFDLPTLIIHGTEDQTVPIDVSARPAAKLVPSATLEEYEGAPHGLFATHADRLSQDLLDFLGA